MNGKKICKSLREIRCRIAQANDIDFTPHVCTHEGDCAGTCPACESELRYIERQLLRRTATGKKVALAGLALGAASLMPMHAQQVATATPQATTQRPTPRLVDAAPGDTTAVVVRGKVIDKDDQSECIGASVILEGTNRGTATDIDGNFAIRVPRGSKLKISYVGYKKVTIIGGIGGRLDHTISNIQDIVGFYAKGLDITMMDARNTFTVLGPGSYMISNDKADKENTGISSEPGDPDSYFSVFAYTENAVISETGSSYPLDHHTITNTYPLGVSNKISENKACLTVHEGVVLFLMCH